MFILAKDLKSLIEGASEKTSISEALLSDSKVSMVELTKNQFSELVEHESFKKSFVSIKELPEIFSTKKPNQTNKKKKNIQRKYRRKQRKYAQKHGRKLKYK